MEYKAFFDGASKGNPGPASAGAVIIDEKEAPVWELSAFLGKKTNNEAEYMSLLMLLQELARRELKNVEICGDSKLVVNQINGLWKVRKPHLIELYRKAKKLFDQGEHSLSWVPREKNSHADKLCNDAMGSGEKEPVSSFDPDGLEKVHKYIFIAHGREDYAVDTFHRNCSCPSFKRSRDCKHLRAALAVNEESR